MLVQSVRLAVAVIYATASAHDVEVSSLAEKTYRQSGQPRPNRIIPSGWRLNTQFSDEFSDVLNVDKWTPFNPNWYGRDPGQYKTEMVNVSNGVLKLSVDLCDSCRTSRFQTGTIVSTKRLLYGYIEARARAAPASVSSAFWLYAEDPHEWTEIDVFENTGNFRERFFSNTNLHVFRSPVPEVGNYEARLKVPMSAPTDLSMHTFGLLWTEDMIEWSIDGKIVRRVLNRYWHQPLNIVFDVEIMKDWIDVPNESDLPVSFDIDYCRAWSAGDGTSGAQ